MRRIFLGAISENGCDDFSAGTMRFSGIEVSRAPTDGLSKFEDAGRAERA